MLQDIRANAQGTVAKIIVGLIVIAFALFGVESILLGGGGNSVAEVNGEEISPQELQQAINNQRRQLIAMLGDNLDPALLDDQRLTGQAMESLIQRKLLTQSAKDMDLAIPDSQLGAIIAGMEQFQMDGQFSPELYRATLADVGFTPSSFKSTLQNDMLISQVRSGLSGSEFATPAELQANARIVQEQRDVRYLTIPVDQFKLEQNVTASEIESYYREHSEEFMSAEAVELNYIELNASDFREPLDEQVLRDAYQQTVQENQYATENRVSHILLQPREGESKEDLQARVADVQSKIAEGAEFAELAREYSDDIGSSGAGGDLGFSRGDAFPEAMEAAIKVLSVNGVSPPVETDAGIHLILLTERREGKPPGFEEMRPELEETLQMAEARKVLLRTVESLKDLAFNADNLLEPAEELSLEVKQSGLVSRTQSEGLFARPSLLTAAFSDEVLNAGHNSDVIEIDADHWVALRVKEHYPPAVLPLTEVYDQIAAAITAERSRAAVIAAAKEAIATLRSGERSLESVATDGGYEWQVELGADRRNMNLPPEVLQRAFSLAPPPEGESVIDFVQTPAGDALVYELDRVIPGDLAALPAPEQQRLRQQVGVEYGQLIDREYQQSLRADADITVM